jgi:2-octaprenyl-6-methoxyphenol hydroxylase
MISIVGTGLAGLTMAYALAKDDFAVTLIGLPPVSQKNDDRTDDRTTAILQPNCDYLTALGLWSDLSATATPLIMMELIDGNNQVSFDASELNLDQFGYNIDNAALKKSLIQKIGQTKNITWYKTELESAFLQAHGWRLELKNGKTHSTSLLIGADGRNSTVRHALGISYDEKPEQQAALVTMLTIEKPHHYTSVEWYRSGGPLTLVPCQGKKMAVVWCDQEDIIDQLDI